MGRKQNLRRLSEAAFRWSPGLALRLADRRGRLLGRGGEEEGGVHAPSRVELERLLGPGARDDSEETRRRCVLSDARSRLIKNVAFRSGYRSMRRLLSVRGEERVAALRARGLGVVVATWHAGPTPAVWAALLEAGVELWRISNREGPVEAPGWRVLRLTGAPFEGAAMLKSCVRHLRGGGWVGGAFDVLSEGARLVEVPVFGRAVPLPTGLPALAVVAGCPIVPAVSRWDLERNRICVEFHEPIEPESVGGTDARGKEEALLRLLAGQLESYYRAYPWELTKSKAGWLLRFPPVGEEGVRQLRPGA